MIITLSGFMGCGKTSIGKRLASMLFLPLIDLDNWIVKAQGRTIPEIFHTQGEAAFRSMELAALKELLSPDFRPLEEERLATLPVWMAATAAVAAEDPMHTHSEAGTTVTAEKPTPAHSEAETAASRRTKAVAGVQTPKGASDFILSLGGGTLTTEECAALVRERTVCIYLRATADTLESVLRNDNGKRPMLASDTTLRERIDQLMKERELIYELTAHHIVDIDGKGENLIAREITSQITGLTHHVPPQGTTSR